MNNSLTQVVEECLAQFPETDLDLVVDGLRGDLMRRLRNVDRLKNIRLDRARGMSTRDLATKYDLSIPMVLYYAPVAKPFVDLELRNAQILRDWLDARSVGKTITYKALAEKNGLSITRTSQILNKMVRRWQKVPHGACYFGLEMNESRRQGRYNSSGEYFEEDGQWLNWPDPPEPPEPPRRYSVWFENLEWL